MRRGRCRVSPFQGARAGLLWACVFACPAIAAAQVDDAGATANPAAAGVANQDPRRDLASRFVFREVYTPSGAEDAVGLRQYQVAFHEVITTTRPVAGEEKTTTETFDYRGRYTERVAELGPTGARNVSSVFRRYEQAKVENDPFAVPGVPPLAEGLTVWSRDFGEYAPLLVVATPERDLYEHEYRFAIGNPYFPRLAYLLPEQAVRIGESWPLTRTATTALAGVSLVSGALNARLVSVDEFSGEFWPNADEIATIEIEGQLGTANGSVSVKAQVEFVFRESSPTGTRPGENAAARPLTPGAAVARGGGAATAIGAIRKIRMAQVSINNDPRGGQPTEIRRLVVAERRWPRGQEPIADRQEIPRPTAENSWLTYVATKGGFRLKHPAAYIVRPAPMGETGESVTLLASRGANLIDRIQISYDPEKPVNFDSAFENSFKEFELAGYKKIAETTRVLPPEQWGNLEVRRVNAAFVPDEVGATAPAQSTERLHFDGYLIVEGVDRAVVAYAETQRDDTTVFRDEVEAILKTIKITPR